jgi:hypothetical protein
MGIMARSGSIEAIEGWLNSRLCWLDATDAAWLYGEYDAIGLAVPDCAKVPLVRRTSPIRIVGGGVGAVGIPVGK